MNVLQARARRYPFEGAQVTVAELRARLPAYSDSFLRRALEAGASSLAELAVARERGLRAQRDGQKFALGKSPWRKGTPGLRRTTA